MPKRKAPEIADTTEMDYNQRLKISNMEEKNIRRIVQSIMFSFGDAECPFIVNEDLVLDLLKNELIYILEDIKSLKTTKNSPISLSNMLRLLQNQKGVLSRFLKYLKTRVKMTEYTKTSTISQKTNICGEDVESDDENGGDSSKVDSTDDVDDIRDVDGEEGEYINKKRKKLTSAAFEEQLLEEVYKCFKNSGLDVNEYMNFNDSIYNERYNALIQTISKMEANEYAAYTNSRRVSFQKSFKSSVNYDSDNKGVQRKKTLENNQKSLLTWIGNPPIDGYAAEMFFSFVAKEVVMEIVGEALLVKLKLPLPSSFPLRLMPNQEFDSWDLLAAPLSFTAFFLITFLISCTFLNFCLVQEQDELTKMEIWAAKRNLNWRCGPHSKLHIQKILAESLK